MRTKKKGFGFGFGEIFRFKFKKCMREKMGYEVSAFAQKYLLGCQICHGEPNEDQF